MSIYFTKLLAIESGLIVCKSIATAASHVMMNWEYTFHANSQIIVWHYIIIIINNNNNNIYMIKDTVYR